MEVMAASLEAIVQWRDSHRPHMGPVAGQLPVEMLPLGGAVCFLSRTAAAWACLRATSQQGAFKGKTVASLLAGAEGGR